MSNLEAQSRGDMPSRSSMSNFDGTIAQRISKFSDDMYLSTVEQMPVCVEKSLLKLQILFYNGKNGAVLQDSWKNELDLLTTLTLDDEFSNEEFSNSFRRLIDLSAASDSDGIFKTMFDCVSRCLASIRKLDAELLVSLIQKTESLSLSDKHVILLLGDTGAGKSTTIHYLGGSQFSYDKKRGHYDIVKPGSEELISFVTQAGMISETSFINPFNLKLNNDEFTLCDTPGFGDNRGVEVDLSNSCGIAKAVINCQSVRLLLLISSKDIGSRCDGLIKFLRTICSFVKDIPKNKVSFAFWFTHFRQDDAESIAYRIEQKMQCLEGDSLDEDVQILLRHMISTVNCRKNEDGSERGAVVIVPDDGNRDAFLQELITTTQPVVNPAEVFQVFAVSENLNKLRIQQSLNEKSIRRAFERDHIALVEYKLRQMKIMTSVYDIEETRKAYRECVGIVKTQTEEYLKRLSLRYDSFTNRDEDNKFEADLSEYATEILKILSYDVMRNDHFDEEVPDLRDLSRVACLSTLWREQGESLIDTFDKYCDPLVAAQMFSVWRKLASLNRTFDETFFNSAKEIADIDMHIQDSLLHDYQKYSSSVNTLLLDSVSAFSNHLLQNQFKDALALLPRLRILSQEESIHKSKSKIELEPQQSNIDSVNYDCLCAALIDAVNTLLTGVNEAINLCIDLNGKFADIIVEKLLIAIRVKDSLVEALDETKNLFPKLDMEPTARCLGHFSDCLSRLKFHIRNSVTGILTSPDPRKYKSIKDVLGFINELTKDAESEAFFSSDLNQVILDINMATIGLKEKLLREIGMMKNNTWETKCEDFLRSMAVLSEATDLHRLHESLESDSYDQILEEFHSLITELSNKLNESTMMFESPHQLGQNIASLNFLSILAVGAAYADPESVTYEPIISADVETEMSTDASTDNTVPVPVKDHIKVNTEVGKAVTYEPIISADVETEMSTDASTDNTVPVPVKDHIKVNTEVAKPNFNIRLPSDNDIPASQVSTPTTRPKSRSNELINKAFNGTKAIFGFMKGSKSGSIDDCPYCNESIKKKSLSFSSVKTVKCHSCSRICHEKCTERVKENKMATYICLSCVKSDNKVEDSLTVENTLNPVIETPASYDSQNQRLTDRDTYSSLSYDIPSETPVAEEVPTISSAISVKNTGKDFAQKSVGLCGVKEVVDYRLEHTVDISNIAQLMFQLRLTDIGKMSLDVVYKCLNDINQQLKLALIEFDTTSKEFKLNVVKAWNVITYLMMVSKLDFTVSESEVLLARTTEFTNIHYLNLNEFITAHMESVFTSSASRDSCKASSKEVLITLTYLKSLCHQFETNNNDTSNVLHEDLFYTRSSELIQSFIDNKVSWATNQLQVSNKLSDDSYSLVLSKMISAEALVLLDPLLMSMNCTTNFNAVLSDIKKAMENISSSITADIDNDLFSKVTTFFQTQSSPELQTVLTNRLEKRIRKILEILNRLSTTTADLQALEIVVRDDMRKLYEVRESGVHKYAIEPLCSCFEKSMGEIEGRIIKCLKAFVTSSYKLLTNYDFGSFERLMQQLLGVSKCLDSVSVTAGPESVESAIIKQRDYISKIVMDTVDKLRSLRDEISKTVSSNQNALDTAAIEPDDQGTLGYVTSIFTSRTPGGDSSPKSLGHQSTHAVSAKTNQSQLNRKSINKTKKTNYSEENSQEKTNEIEAFDKFLEKIKDLKPKEVWGSLQTAANEGESEFYSNQSKALVDNTRDIMLSVFDASVSGLNLNDQTQDHAVSVFTGCISYLPTSIGDDLRSRIETFNEAQRNEKENFERDLGTKKGLETVHDLYKDIIKYYNNRNYKYCLQSKRKLTGILDSFIRQTSLDLKAGKIKTVLSCLNQYWKQCIEFISICKKASDKHHYHNHDFSTAMRTDSLQDCLLNIIDDIHVELKKLWAALDTTSLSDRHVYKSSMTKHLEILMTLADMSAVSSNEIHLFNYLDPSTLRSNMGKALRNIAESIDLHKKMIDEELLKLGFDSACNTNVLNDALCAYHDASDTLEILKVFSKTCKAEFRSSVNVIEKFKPLAQYKTELESAMRTLYQSLQTPVDNNLIMTFNPSDRNEVYQSLAIKYSTLQQCVLLQHHFDQTPLLIEEQIKRCKSHFGDMFDRLERDIGNLMNQIFLEDTSQLCKDPDIYQRIDACRDNFRSADSEFVKFSETMALRNMIFEKNKEIELKFREKLLSYKKWILNDFRDNPNKVISVLEVLKMFTYYVYSVDNVIDDILKQLSPETIVKLSQMISENADNQFYGLLQLHSAFKAALRTLWFDVVEKFTIDDVLRGLKCNDKKVDSTTESKIKKLYESFQHMHMDLVNKAITSNRLDEMNAIVAETAKVANDRSLSKNDMILSLMANLFAYWTLYNFEEEKSSVSESSYEDDDRMDVETDQTSIVKAAHSSRITKPHAGQIVALFRIFGLDQDVSNTLFQTLGKTLFPDKDISNFQIDNQIVEILTGEGKSVILAVASSILALLGHAVDCVCYSEYLCTRDEVAFKYLFDAFNISQFISYGTLTALCEKTLENQAQGSIRDQVKALMGIKSSLEYIRKQNILNRPKVLLIDEVDVFFSEDFYGEMYKPVATVEHSSITAVIDLIWNKFSANPLLRFTEIDQSSEYQNCVKAFPGFENLISESIKCMYYQRKQMLSDAKNNIPTPSNRVYQVKNNKLYYKDQDQLTDSISFGYITMWSYFEEHKKGKVDNATLKSKKKLSVDCGRFSIAEVPKLYDFILGVSGTVKSLIDDPIITRSYNIHKFSSIPSVYGSNHLEFQPNNGRDIVIENESSYFVKISNQIEEKSKSVRPVLVFFESSDSLHRYYHSAPNQKHKSKCITMTEDITSEDKAKYIQQAMSVERITLLTRDYGRGTDFIVVDKKVKDEGGAHVIQTFLSEDVSEEIQIKGRTARQGGKGSYSMVLLDKNLEKFSIFSEQIEEVRKNGGYDELLNKKRSEYIESTHSGMKQNVQSYDNEHKLCLDFLGDLVSKRIVKVSEFLTTANQCPLEFTTGKDASILILMDATGSMSGTLSNAKNAVSTMFSRTKEILNDKNDSRLFEVQFAVYRNYNVNYKSLLEWSTWTSDAMELVRFLKDIDTAGGMGNEAIEMGFWHVNRELSSGKDISRILLIGDMPPNTIDEVIDRQDEYSSNGNDLPDHYSKELDKMLGLNPDIEICTFYLNGIRAAREFQKIADKTGGECMSLDVSDPSEAAEVLVDKVTSNFLHVMGGQQYVDAYNVKFKKGYIKD